MRGDGDRQDRHRRLPAAHTSSLGQATDNKLAHFQAAAQRKIVEKVKDLAEEFQELGPRFHVEVLDIQDEDFEPKLKEIKDRSPALAEAIDKAPANSIFFFSQGRVQRLGFSDIYQLDSEASVAANDNKGNLILNYQGVGPFARKILNIEEKKPRVGLAVVHEILSLDDPQDPRLTMNGAKKVLASYGFETRDIILKKWSEMGPEPTVYTFDESHYEGLEEQRLELEANIKERDKEIQDLENKRRAWKTPTIAELNKRFAVVLVQGRQQPLVMERDRLAELDKAGQKYKTLPVSISEEHRSEFVSDFETDLTLQELSMDQEKRELATVVSEQKGLNVDNLAEQRRITDLGAKMTRLLADVDLLIVPRMTFLDIPRRDIILNRAHKLDEAQLGAIKEFMKAGKPVLFLLGPANEPKRELEMPDLGGPDPLEDMLASLGFKMPKQTILFNVETKSFAERRGNLIIQGTQVEVPPVEFDWKPGAGLPGRALASKKKPLSIRSAPACAWPAAASARARRWTCACATPAPSTTRRPAASSRRSTMCCSWPRANRGTRTIHSHRANARRASSCRRMTPTRATSRKSGVGRFPSRRQPRSRCPPPGSTRAIKARARTAWKSLATAAFLSAPT